MTTAPRPILPRFDAPYAEDDVAIARNLLVGARLTSERERRIDDRARGLIKAVRDAPRGFGSIEALLREYSLSTREGIVLMALAESILRIPDSATADRLIAEKLSEADFAHHVIQSRAWLTIAASWALGVTAQIVQSGERPDAIVEQLIKRLGMPAIRAATRSAVRLLGDQFAYAQTIEDALSRAQFGSGRLERYSFDMLGEGARTRADAAHYLDAYAHALQAIGAVAGRDAMPNRPGISVKLSALHPRFNALDSERVMDELVPRVADLAREARVLNLCLTLDAEEADRLELTLEVFATLVADAGARDWTGLGLAIQAYQKRALAVVDYVAGLASASGRRVMIRLVKGAYWDTEIKRAQERGLNDYPVFTRKAMTDLNYIACVDRLLAARAHVFPQFATHNALTVASIVERANGIDGFEFQRLHGMGDALYEALVDEFPNVTCRRYAPVGNHTDLLAYLIRRLLENSANSSFVSAVVDPAVPVETLLVRPAAVIGAPEAARHAGIPRPPDMFMSTRRNSAGIEFGHRRSVANLILEIDQDRSEANAAPIINGVAQRGMARQVVSPIDSTSVVGLVIEGNDAFADAAMTAAHTGFREWSSSPTERRASMLESAADRSRIDRERAPATRDAALVRRLGAAGAVLVGALNMDEYAYGFSTENHHYGATRNPHDRTRIAGGSSGGSAAAVAASLVPLTLGSDTNGSIRVPAAMCGVFALKPTYGRLSRAGMRLFAASIDHAGPFCRSTADLAASYDAMQGPDPDDPACTTRAPEPTALLLARGLDGIRIAVANGYFTSQGVPAVFAAVERVAAAFSVSRRVELPTPGIARAAAMIVTSVEGAACISPI